jgi:HEPN domain-containing protein
MRDPAEEGRRWLKQAEEDLRWARHLAREGAYHLACFLAQQVAEKALKAFLYAQGREIVLGHSVERLCREAAHYDVCFDEHASRWAILDGYYVPTRYPNSLPGSIPAEVYTREAADEAVRLAGEVVEMVRARIPKQKEAP